MTTTIEKMLKEFHASKDGRYAYKGYNPASHVHSIANDVKGMFDFVESLPSTEYSEKVKKHLTESWVYLQFLIRELEEQKDNDLEGTKPIPKLGFNSR